MQIKAVSPRLFQLLQELMTLDTLDAFSLGGGTSIALRFGHRKSTDIDLFCNVTFDTEDTLNAIGETFEEHSILNRTQGSLCLEINQIKIDILRHTYPMLAPIDTVNNIRLLSLNDIAAMKINAVTNRGSKKDFSDLLLLHQNGISLTKSLDLFCRKYGNAGRFLAIRSLQFFEDAHQEPDPLYLNGWNWNYVEKEFQKLSYSLM